MMKENEDWTKQWERQVVNDEYPLRRFLGRSNHSAVFLTESKAQKATQAAIKIQPSHPSLKEAQLAHWRRVMTLSHPHLIRLLDVGQCKIGGHDFFFVVMEYAEENLAEILPKRALNPAEMRDVLRPTLDVLAYLHGKNLAHGALTPTNILVVDDQLKLASDTIRPAGECTASTAKPSLYDPPEARNGKGSTAGDMWALGITVVEALTQTAPAWSRERFESVSVPSTLPTEFLDMVERCLNREPQRRPAVVDLVAEFSDEPPATAPATPPLINEPLVRTLATQASPRTRWVVTTITIGIVVLWAAWTGVHLYRTHGGTRLPAVTSGQSVPNESVPAVASPSVPLPAVSAPTSATPLVASAAVAPRAASVPTVVHQEMPETSRRARNSIRGTVKVEVRIIVDRSGSVVAASVVERESSKYFARAASDAAKRWKFATAADPVSRPWLLHFEFSRAGATARLGPAQ